MNYWCLLNEKGEIETKLRSDLPAGYSPPKGFTLVADDKLPNNTPEKPITELTYDVIISNGYLDIETGIRLSALTEDQSRFTSILTRINLGLSLGEYDGNTINTIFDIYNKEIQLSISNLQPLMLRYMNWCDTQYKNLAP